MVRRIAFVLAVIVASGLLDPAPTWAAPCAQACRDEVLACRDSECAGLAGKPMRRCRRACKQNLVRDCTLDLSVCGATTARPGSGRPKPGSPSDGGGW